SDKADIPARVFEKLKPGDVVIALGAGDINRSLDRIAELLRENPLPVDDAPKATS
ncbi:MAG: UDP-N-acetylmuramate--L-alanine ligase, partial [Deltaproteobacteria bacterium]|nr:UDP-N-acetylmuramate--L-alanine ligase [Deltaproteobacteria bacterium]